MSNQLPVLPDVEFVTTDPQQIIDDITSGFEQIEAERLNNPNFRLGSGDPRRMYLLAIAYVIIQLKQELNQTGKDNLLYYAKGDMLDHIGLSRRTPRIDAQPAVTTLRFTLSSIRGTNTGIPQGTRATSNNALYWRTTAPATIVAGQLFVDVPAEAMTAGTIGNDIAIGDINRLVDPIPYVAQVSNTTATSGGRDREDDESYRYRIYQAPIGFSIAGPEEAYKFFALSASSAIVDVSATSPSDGVVKIVPLLENGGIPSESILDLVKAACNPSTIRPLTDQVTVEAPDEVSYNIESTYFIRRSDGSSESVIQSRVDDAVQVYIAWQQERLGRDIDPGELNALVRAAGAKRIAIVSPTLTDIEPTEVAKAGTVTLTYGGLEDD